MMRAWKITGKYPVYNDDGKIGHTDVSLASTDGGYATFSERLTGDCRHKTDKELVALTLEAFFKSEFSEKAMAESVQKVDELDRLISSFRKEMEELKNKTMAEMKAETERNREMLKIAFMTLNAMMAGDEEDEEDFDDVEDSEEELN